MRRLGAFGLAGLLLLLLVGARGHGSSSHCAAGTGVARFAGRPVVLHVPPGAGRTLLIVLHGYRGSARQMERYTGFDGRADAGGFAVAYPSSAGPYWNSNAVRTRSDDVAYLSRLITDLETRLCPHPDRVVLAGVSNGGGMAALAACRLAGRVAGLASVAGGYDGQPPCRPGRALPVFEIHGTADPVVPYFGASRRRTPDGLPPFVNGWLARDGCRGRPARVRLSPRSLQLRWSSCAPGAEVEHVRIIGGRHQWPRAIPPDPGPDAGFSASAEIVRFLTGLPGAQR
jgi:polyhydroxybutyrate depolymerase